MVGYVTECPASLSKFCQLHSLLFVLCEGGGDPVKFFFYIHHETASPALAQFHFLEKKKKDINEPTLLIPYLSEETSYVFKSNKTEEHSMELYVRLRYPDELTTLPGTVLHDSNEKN